MTGRCPNRFLITLLSFVVAAGVSRKLVLGAMPDKSPPAAPSQLRDDLLLKGLPQNTTRPITPTPTPAQGTTQPPAAASQRQGEDLHAESGGLLPRIGNRMRQVQQRLRQRDTSQATQTVEQQISSDLQQVIQQLQKECSNRMSAAEKRSTQASRSGKPGEKPGKKPGKQAARRAGPAGEAGVGPSTSDDLQKAMSEFWGHLPTRYRRQLQDVRAVEFLPEYQKLIEQYYKRLAEQPDSQP